MKAARLTLVRIDITCKCKDGKDGSATSYTAWSMGGLRTSYKVLGTEGIDTSFYMSMSLPHMTSFDY